MVSVEDLARTLNDPKLIGLASEEAGRIAVVADARARCEINRYNNESRFFRYSRPETYLLAEKI